MNGTKLLETFLDFPIFQSELLTGFSAAPSKNTLHLPVGAMRSLSYAVLVKKSKVPMLFIVPSFGEAQVLRDELRFWVSEENIEVLPPLDVFPFEGLLPNAEVVGERLKILSKIYCEKRFVVIAPVKAILFKTITPEQLKLNTISLEKNKTINREMLFARLVSVGYARRSIVGEKGEFAVRGGIVDIFPSQADLPIRIEFLGEEVESIRTFDPYNQRSFAEASKIEIIPCQEEFMAPVFEHLPSQAGIVLEEPIKIAKVCDRIGEEAKGFSAGDAALFMDFDNLQETLSGFSQLVVSELSGFEEEFVIDVARPKEFHKNLDAFRQEVSALVSQGQKVAVVSKHANRILDLLPDEAMVLNGDLKGGFVFKPLNFVLFTDKEIFEEEKRPQPKTSLPKEGVNRELLMSLKDGDYVVHENYGIGIYRGLEMLDLGEGNRGEYLQIEYQSEDRLFVPLHHMGLVQRFSAGDSDYKPKLDKLGSHHWEKTKSKAKTAIRDMTQELLKLYAVREKGQGFAYPSDDVYQAELEETFPYEETPDQKKTIDDVKRDLESTRPMDRLVCGDVGYGKTEVAVRAALKVVTSGKQVAVLVPTTILAEQHFNTFKERFSAFPFRVEMLSRFLSKEEQKKIVEEVGKGKVDVIIGTHRLLQKDISFRDLGLLVLDEEQKFGVVHKEKLKKLKANIDILALTATPIPRTLHFSLSGIRDMSVINTPPVDRLPVRTYVSEWGESLVKEAILKEVERGGQVFYVHPFVSSIRKVTTLLEKLVPDVKFGIVHGQLSPHQLEKTMIDFLDRKFEVLVCTNIIESGLDIPTVNTIIVDQADRFGLSQLYQLRGRVGRSSLRAYAYLLYQRGASITDCAIERLKTLQQYTALGSGYQIALKDLQIRGSGNLLGAQQSGHIAAIGFDLYTELLEEAAKELKGIIEHAPRETTIDLKINAYIPAEYVEDERQRIATYRRMNYLAEEKEIEEMKKELKDRFGAIPMPLLRLFRVLRLKLKARKCNVKAVEGDKDRISIHWWDKKSHMFNLEVLPEEEWFRRVEYLF
ncbi:MAG: transcription-repair coupling factor [Candidatus Saganbacteria bacterium]|nr:transcription-repair coupling factor [Candidatus Saganbacteria bacterium]